MLVALLSIQVYGSVHCISMLYGVTKWMDSRIYTFIEHDTLTVFFFLMIPRPPSFRVVTQTTMLRPLGGGYNTQCSAVRGGGIKTKEQTTKGGKSNHKKRTLGGGFNSKKK